jgi:ADP-heptose:LPS heptosyltransferase
MSSVVDARAGDPALDVHRRAEGSERIPAHLTRPKDESQATRSRVRRPVDARGRTSLLEVMAIIRHRCPILVAPDSGPLTMTYYLDTDAPIGVVSLWADPRQGILKQGVQSPNPKLRHRAILAPDERIENITTDSVMAALCPFILCLPGPSRDRPRLPRAAATPRFEPA